MTMIKLFKYKDSVFCIENARGGVLKLSAYRDHFCVWCITVNMNTELKCKIKDELKHTTNKQRVFNEWYDDVYRYFNLTLHTYLMSKLENENIKKECFDSVWDSIKVELQSVLEPVIKKCLRDYVECIYDNKNVQE